jgi:hypothetical protein
MNFLIELTQRGGPFMWLLLLLLPATLVLACARFAMARQKSLPGIGMAVVGMLLATGVMGDALGMRQAIKAVAHASEPLQAVLLEAGLAVSRIPLDSAAGMAAVGAVLFLAGWLRSLGHEAQRGPLSGLNLALNGTSLILALVAAGLLISQRGTAMEAIASGDSIAHLWRNYSVDMTLTWAIITAAISFLVGAAGTCLTLATALSPGKTVPAYGRSTSR